MSEKQQKVVTFLWFDDNAEEAMNYYVSVFKNARVLEVMRMGEGPPGPAGGVTLCRFELEGQEFMAMNGGPEFKLTEAVSLLVRCETQEEVDYYWNRLTADGGEEAPCGWLKDKFGLSWQITPNALMEMMSDPDPEKARRTMEAMLQMQKIDIAALEEAYAGAPA